MTLQTFLKDPLGFAKKHPLVFAFTEFGGKLPTNSSQLKQKNVARNGANDLMYQIRGQHRIVWFNLAQARNDPRTWEIDLVSRPKPNYEPAYWLPWQEDQVYRITLRPSVKVNDDQAYQHIESIKLAHDNAQDRMEAVQAYKQARQDAKDIEPDIFFTAPVNGCSVFVEGPPWQPTVYHANAMGHIGTFDNYKTKKEFVDLQVAKIAHMRKRYKAFSTEHEKFARRWDNEKSGYGPGHSGREANMQDYLSRGFDPKVFEDEFDEIMKAFFETPHLKNVVIDDDKVKVFSVEGTIFGRRRQDQNWEFFFQKRAQLDYLVSAYKTEVSQQSDLGYLGSFLNPWSWNRWAKQRWRQYSLWVTLDADKFYPGNGHVILRGR